MTSSHILRSLSICTRFVVVFFIRQKAKITLWRRRRKDYFTRSLVFTKEVSKTTPRCPQQSIKTLRSRMLNSTPLEFSSRTSTRIISTQTDPCTPSSEQSVKAAAHGVPEGIQPSGARKLLQFAALRSPNVLTGEEEDRQFWIKTE